MLLGLRKNALRIYEVPELSDELDAMIFYVSFLFVRFALLHGFKKNTVDACFWE